MGGLEDSGDKGVSKKGTTSARLKHILWEQTQNQYMN